MVNSSGLVVYHCNDYLQMSSWRPASKPLAGRIRAIWGVLRELSRRTQVIELVLPGGTVLAILCWLYRRRRVTSVSVTHQGSILGWPPERNEPPERPVSGTLSGGGDWRVVACCASCSTGR